MLNLTQRIKEVAQRETLKLINPDRDPQASDIYVQQQELIALYNEAGTSEILNLEPEVREQAWYKLRKKTESLIEYFERIEQMAYMRQMAAMEEVTE